jgi:hypothetical protein
VTLTIFLLGQVSRFEPQGPFEIGGGGYVANSNLGNEYLRPETFDRSRREVPLRTAESSADTGPWQGKLRKCRAILWARKSCRDVSTSWWWTQSDETGLRQKFPAYRENNRQLF